MEISRFGTAARPACRQGANRVRRRQGGDLRRYRTGLGRTPDVVVAAMAIGRPVRARLAQWAVGSPLHAPYRLARILLPGAYADDGLISIHRHARTSINGSGVYTSGCGQRPTPAGAKVISSSAASEMGF